MPLLNDPSVVLPRTGITLDAARNTLTGLHFAKESLSASEREILYIAEGLLRLIDDTYDVDQVTRARPDLAPVVALTRKPGVFAIDLYNDAVEVVGTPGDSDGSAGVIKGTFDLADLRSIAGELIVTDRRDN